MLSVYTLISKNNKPYRYPAAIRRSNRIAKSFPFVCASDDVIVCDKISLNYERILFNVVVTFKHKKFDLNVLRQAMNSGLYLVRH